MPAPREKSPAEKLFKAIQEGKLQRALTLIRKDPGLLKARNENGHSPVLLAAYYGADRLAERFIAEGAQVNLFEAATLGKLELVQSLIGITPAGVKAYSHDGWTPLHLAAHFGRPAVAAYLIDQGADLNALSRNQLANTPLHAAVAGGQVAVTRMLLERGAEAGVLANGFTPMHLAAHKGHQPLVDLLLAFGAPASVPGSGGKTPADMAAEQGYYELAKLLRKYL